MPNDVADSLCSRAANGKVRQTQGTELELDFEQQEDPLLPYPKPLTGRPLVRCINNNYRGLVLKSSHIYTHTVPHRHHTGHTRDYSFFYRKFHSDSKMPASCESLPKYSW
jgi:hypothetical protein